VYSSNVLDSKGGIGDPIDLREEDVALLETGDILVIMRNSLFIRF
jgi:hypothetical protein